MINRAMAEEHRTLDLLSPLRELPRVLPHCGTASLRVGNDEFNGNAEFLLPASGHAVVAFHSSRDLPDRNFGYDLVVEGTTTSGPFRIECPEIYTRRAGKSCALVSPVNAPAVIRYGAERPVLHAVALLSNFDFRTGDIVTHERGWTRRDTPCQVEANDRRVTFRQRPDRLQLLALAAAGVLHSVSAVDVIFDVLDGDSDSAISSFATDVAAMCTFAGGAGVSVSALDLVDSNGAVVRRIVPRPVTVRHYRCEIVSGLDLPLFFRECFGAYRRMLTEHAAWTKLASYCASLEDPPFLEQKLASLMMALEFFIRNSLLEAHQRPDWVRRLDLIDLVGAARQHLEWQVPRHYTTKKLIEKIRNAVVHGDELPSQDFAELRRLFDKWRLFLFRRILIRLGYAGHVVSPERGWASRSAVDDFSEEANDFRPADPAAVARLEEVFRSLRSPERR